jgi:hypothetical protein
MKAWQKLILVFLVLLVLGGAALLLPPVRERVFTRLENLRMYVFYTLNPPEQAVFSPGATTDAAVAAVVQATLTRAAQLITPSPSPLPSSTPTPLPPDAPTPVPTATLAPPPAQALVANVPYVDQHYGFNNCAPANLTMALKFWGWTGTREQVAEAVKPFSKDKNVMPYELVDYVNDQTGMRALTRVGGTPELLKRLVANNFPTIVESGVYLLDLTNKVSWMGHYQYVYGYDDATQTWQVKDSFEQNGDRYTENYPDLVQKWRAFDYAYVVVYPPEQEGALLALLGSAADDNAANQFAATTAASEITSTTGQDQFFAMYNQGTSLVRLQNYKDAAVAFDGAFKQYANLAADKRPWRMLWYQTGPYYAYFWTGRYNDVISLADKTISAASEPYIEESFYWRARAKSALGDNAGAADDLRKSLEYHPNFGPSVALLAQLGTK